MVVNKNKITVQAQKFTAKGQFEKAIQEYRKILKADPVDIRTWLKMGDLYTRMGARKEACETYLKVAEHYRKNDFQLKAVAVYRQVLKLDPTLLDIYEQLADAYLSLGLTSDALIQFEQLADMCQRSGNTRRMLGVLSRMAQVDPQNISTRLRIAEQCSKEGDLQGAVGNFAAVCKQLDEQGRVDDYIKVAERLLYHDTSQVDVAQKVSGFYLEKGQWKRALAKLQICFARDPRNLVTLELLAEAFGGLEQPDKAVSVYTEIANILEDQNQVGERRRVMRKILELEPNNSFALEGLNESLPNSYTDLEELEEYLPSPAEAITDNTQVTTQPLEHPAKDDAVKRAEKLLGEAEVLIKYGLTERAIDHLHKIYEFDYFNLEARERLKDLFLENGDDEGAIEQLMILADGFVDEQPEGSVYFLHQVLNIDPTYKRARMMLREIGGVFPEGVTPLGEDGQEPVSADTDMISFGEGEFEDDSESLVSKPARLSIDDIPYSPGDNVLTEKDLEGIDLDSDRTSGLDLIDSGIDDTDSMSFPVTDRELVSLGKALPSDDLPDLGSDLPDLDEELPDLDVEDDNLFDTPELTPVVTAVPIAEPKIATRPEKKSRDVPKQKERVIPVSASVPTKDIPPTPAVAPSAPDLTEEIEEIVFFNSQGLYEEARGLLEGLLEKYPRHPRLKELAVEIRRPRRKQAVADRGSLDLAALSEDIDLAEVTHDDVINEIEEVFSQFKAGVRKQIAETDYATHYDLGVAYKEMGLLEDAINEFRVASGDPNRRATAENMIGICTAALGNENGAMSIFQAALRLPGLKKSEEIAVLYEIGKIHESHGRSGEALDVYNRILNVDPGFADVVERVDSLSQE